MKYIYIRTQIDKYEVYIRTQIALENNKNKFEDFCPNNAMKEVAINSLVMAMIHDQNQIGFREINLIEPFR
jgi:hypothetical protein